MRERSVSALWIGGQLGHWERLSLKSFSDHGFEVTLFTYDPSIEPPPGVRVLPAARILPESMVFENKAHPGTFSGFSNIFRYRLLQLEDTVWIDTDVIALSDSLPNTQHLFGWESKSFVNGAVFGAPRNSDLLNGLYQAAVAVDPASIQWGQLGPRLITKHLIDQGLTGEAQERRVFYPLSYRDIWKAFDPHQTARLLRKFQSSSTLHLWNEVLRGTPAKSAAPPAGSYLDRLLTKHNIDRPLHQIDRRWVIEHWRPQLSPRPLEKGYLRSRAPRVLRALGAVKAIPPWTVNRRDSSS